MADRTQKGHLLKKAREAKGITLEQVQDATKIPLDSLKAIEEGYRVRTLTDFYYRAFVKLYAKYIGVDVKSVLDNNKDEKISAPFKFSKTKNFIKEKIKIPFFQREGVRKVFFGILVLAVIALCAFAIGRGVKAWLSQPRSHSVKMKKIEVKKTTPPKAPVKKKSSETSSDASAVSPKNKKINLTIRAKKQIWVSVSVDGVVRLRTTLGKGAVESWSAKESIEVSGKNLADLEFELNGQPTVPGGKNRGIIKKLIVTPDGFKILD